MSRLRWRTAAMSVSTGPATVPNCPAWCARCATRALQISFLLGRQAMLGQEPPIQRRSTTAVRRPDCAICQASNLPPNPLPRIRTSNCSGWDINPSVCDSNDREANAGFVARLPQFICRCGAALTLEQDGAEPWHQQSAGTDHIDKADLAGSRFCPVDGSTLGLSSPAPTTRAHSLRPPFSYALA